MKILLISEEVTSAPSEGLLVFLMQICRYLGREHELSVIHRDGHPEEGIESFRILSGKLYLTGPLPAFLRKNEYDVVIYIPSSSLTGFGLLRGAMIRRSSSSPVMMITLQHRDIGFLHRCASLFGRPDLILTPVGEMMDELRSAGFRTGFIMPGFDDGLFRPAGEERKRELRRKYGFPEDRYIVLHVGHVKKSRNLQTFLGYREWGEDILPVIKAGEVEEPWLDRLRNEGITVIDRYTDDIHEIYQASDLYLFPVTSPRGALEFPLSVVEAAACNLPVITTRFGALPDIIDEGGGFSYFDSPSEIGESISRIRGVQPETYVKVSDLSWKRVFERFLDPHLESLGSAGPGTGGS